MSTPSTVEIVAELVAECAALLPCGTTAWHIGNMRTAAYRIGSYRASSRHDTVRAVPRPEFPEVAR